MQGLNRLRQVQLQSSLDVLSVRRGYAQAEDTQLRWTPECAAAASLIAYPPPNNDKNSDNDEYIAPSSRAK